MITLDTQSSVPPALVLGHKRLLSQLSTGVPLTRPPPRKTERNGTDTRKFGSIWSRVGVIFHLRQTEICAQNWLLSVCIRRRYIHLNRYFPSVTDGHKCLKNAIFRLDGNIRPKLAIFRLTQTEISGPKTLFSVCLRLKITFTILHGDQTRGEEDFYRVNFALVWPNILCHEC